ncbi:MFS transporter [Streptomyces lunaelactis]|uniref:MFS transporter n=1 Tax=Streptomyces lunaelactis TaxID=1535768 RepID=UPI0015854ACB|nr:MFS transporter [Streptomyces lunaelactis]NUK07232.1 MFS transporter [Streptomyces lunaelactis]NUK72171.1 MFS transporter [Streptomyces lunaelactis]NUK76576.1 MFS transporter [Streptomyces lunaelactis]NUL08871.1 MFS transporter [Streptomyces lunaelactis]
MPSTDVVAPVSPERHRPALALTLILTCQMMLMLDATVVNIALPDIGQELGFSAAGLSWVPNAYTLAFGGLLLIGGRIGDLIGRRRALTIGVLAFTAASLLGGLVDSAGWLLFARAAQGAAAALTAPSTLALVATTFGEGRERERALSLFTATAAAGSAIGMILGGILTEAGSWRWTLFINVPVGLAVAALIPLTIAETQRHRARFDVAGALTGTGGVTALVYAFIRAADHGWGDAQVTGAFVAAAVLLPVFLLVERRVRRPVVALELFAVRSRVIAFAAMLLVPAAMFGVFYFDTQYFQFVRDYSPLRAGVAFLPLAVGIFAASTLAGRLLARHGLKKVAGTGLALAFAGVLWQSTLSTGSGYWTTLFVPLAVNGFGVGLVFMPLSVLILTGIRPDQAGAASGLMQTMQQVGGALGLSALVTVYGSAARGAGGPASGPGAMAEGFSAGLLAAAAFMAVALVLVLASRTPRGTPRPTGSEQQGLNTRVGPAR